MGSGMQEAASSLILLTPISLALQMSPPSWCIYGLRSRVRATFPDVSLGRVGHMPTPDLSPAEGVVPLRPIKSTGGGGGVS